MTLQDRSEIAEARMLIRWAATDLTKSQRAAVMSWLDGESDVVTAIEQGLTRGGVWMARQSAIRKMRRRFEMLGIHSSHDLCSRYV